MNDRIMESANTNIKRFLALDTTTYAAGALDVKTKEMLGLVASMVLRCDDCIKYHLGKCREAGVKHDKDMGYHWRNIIRCGLFLNSFCSPTR